MESNFAKYIVPISTWSKGGCEADGVGILVENLFITAGHVVTQNENISIRIENRNFTFTKEQALLIITPDDEITSSGFDICIFKIDGLLSPFFLSEEDPEINQNLTSISFKQHIIKKHKDVIENDELFANLSSKEEVIEMRFSDGVVSAIENNFFLCKMSVALEPGRSGSPVVNNLKVYGILIGGKDNGNLCGYLSSKSIIKLLRNL